MNSIYPINKNSKIDLQFLPGNNTNSQKKRSKSESPKISYSKIKQKNTKKPLKARKSNTFKSNLVGILLLLGIGLITSKCITVLHSPVENDGTLSKEYNNSNIVGQVLDQIKYRSVLSSMYTLFVGLGYYLMDINYKKHLCVELNLTNILRCFGFFVGINYLVFKIEFSTVLQTSLISVIFSAGNWAVFDGTLHGLLLSISASMFGAWTIFLMNIGESVVISYKEQINLLLYLPILLFSYSILVGSLVRFFSIENQHS
ncbi:hypothetical protein BB559_001820 [Furculomyces boomerangus]|uniref:Uncharacterized protein n=2 Tax=Harpellales TaxID=61421 RepID=A0A2T9Z0E0_9FUNG|nr:hypothetical protein BB559_001820 [Furculomyces boomerangus]PWA03787.1 hypothetical protein BB558_000070 [Smittium angustum]